MAGSRYKIGASLVIDSEREYKKELAEINTGLKVNYSEMALVAAQYDKADASQKKLTAQTKALDGAIAAQTEKVTVLTKSLANSIEKNGEGSKKTLEWRASLNKAEAELAKMNNQMADYQQQMRKLADGTASMADSIRGLAGQMGLDLPPAMDTAIDKLSGFDAAGAALVGTLAAVVIGLGNLSTQIAQYADDVMTQASITGIATDTLQEYMYMTELVDVSVDTLSSSMARMTRSMNEARAGTGQAAEAYQKLGVEVRDSATGQLRDANVVFGEVIDALGQMSNETERDATAMQIFGRSAKDLNPLIETGSARIAELAEEAHKMGVVLSDETLARFGELDDALQRSDQKWLALKITLAEAALPALTAILEGFNEIPTPVLTGITVLAGLVVVMTLVSKVMNGIKATRTAMAAVNALMAGSNAALAGSETAVAGANSLVAGSNMVLGMSFSQLLPYILIVVAALTLLGLVLGIVFGNLNKTKAEMNDVAATAQNMQNSVASIQTPNYSGMNYNSVPGYAKGTTYHPGGLAWVGENGPELVDLPRGSRVYPNGEEPYGNITMNLYVNMDEVDEVAKLVRVMNEAKSSVRRGVAPK